MLTLTETATTVVSNLVAQSGTATTGGLRIDQQGDQYAVTVAEAPSLDEFIVEDHGARVFLATTVAETFDDKVLDATVGDDGSVTFAIATK